MEPETIDPEGAAFTARLSNLLRERRRAEGLRLAELARRSHGRFSARELRRIERGRVAPADAAELTALYGADLAAILPARTPVEVDREGRLRTAGAVEEFTPGDPDSMLLAYLRLIRRLRNAEREPMVALRRDDVVVLAGVLDQPGEQVTDRLGALMGATRAQRRVMVGLFAVGAVVVGVAVTAVAASTGDTVTTPTSTPTPATGDPAIATEPAADPAGDEDPVVVQPPETVFVDEAWSATVGSPGGIDVTPLPADDPPPPPSPVDAPPPPPSPVDAPPPPSPPSPSPAPAPDETPPPVAVGPPPVPAESPPIVDPAPEPVADPEPSAPPDETVAVGPPPVPEPDDLIPTP